MTGRSWGLGAGAVAAAVAGVGLLCCAGGPLVAAGLAGISAAVAGFSGAGPLVVIVLLAAAAGSATVALVRRTRADTRTGGLAEVRIELLRTEACPNAEAYLPRLRELAEAAGITGSVEVRVIEDPEQAQHEHFLGSPTVRINGRDVDPGADDRQDYGLSCRLYPGSDGLHGTPPDEWVLAGVHARI